VPQVSLIIPTRNEKETICECVQKAQQVFGEMGLSGEVLVADSSSDGTAEIADSCGAKVINPAKLGYGNAYLAGLAQAEGQYIVFMDGDLTYDPRAIEDMISILQNGNYDMVIGSRLKGKILPGAMPALHRYIGNPVLTCILNTLFSCRITDAHCGLRAIKKDALNRLNLRSGGMEFATEMLIEAICKDLRVAEVPITYSPRRGVSKLHSITDGWRHLRFMMLYRPAAFLLIPGLLVLIFGVALFMGVYLQGASRMHSLILGGLLAIIGYQMLLAGIYFEAFGATYGLSRSNKIKRMISYYSLEKELLIGATLLIVGGIIGLKVLMSWGVSGFGALDASSSAMMAMIFSILGIQTIFSGMSISLLLLNNGNQD
jgi:glycosyltransferase involved in cell wall biosynthesis